MSGKNTTNLKRHLERPQKLEALHREAYADVLEQENKFRSQKYAEAPKKIDATDNQPKVVDFFNRPYPADHSRQKKIDGALADMILSTSVPLKLIREPSFRRLLNVADVRYQIPWQQRLSKLCDERSNLLLVKMQTQLDQARRISICTDIWTKKGMSQSFLGVTAHFYEKNRINPCDWSSAFGHCRPILIRLN